MPKIVSPWHSVYSVASQRSRMLTFHYQCELSWWGGRARWCFHPASHAYRRTAQIFQSPAHIFCRRTRKTRNPWPSLSFTHIHTADNPALLQHQRWQVALRAAIKALAAAEIAECTKLWLHAFRPISRITHAARRECSSAARALFAALNGRSSPIW